MSCMGEGEHLAEGGLWAGGAKHVARTGKADGLVGRFKCGRSSWTGWADWGSFWRLLFPLDIPT